MEKNIIVLEPYGGLCNRLWSMNAAYWLSRKAGHDLKIVWNIANELYAGFDDILENRGEFEIVENYLVPIRSVKTLFFRMNRNHILSGLKRQCDIEVDDPQWREEKVEDLIKSITGKNVYIRACNKFYADPEHENDYSFIEFRKTLQDKADQIIDQTKGEPIVGMHIRRTDNIDAIKNSGDDAFYRLADQEIKENEKAFFYIATDDKSTESIFRAKYGDRVLTLQEKDFSRQSREGIKHACIDLLCLSKTSKIIGSAHSSFSLVAGELNNVPVVIAH